MEEETEGPSLGRAVSELAREVGTLARQELELARREIADKAERAKGGAARLGAGSGLALAGAFALTLGMILGLTLLLDDWMSRETAAVVSAFSVGAVLGAAGFLLIRAGAARMSPAELLPRRTVESLKEDARWARKQV
ncbi:MAG TPA: phage holin family protein [Planctomycetota bacterium]